MSLSQKEGFADIPAIIRLIAKLIRYAKGGISKEEASDLAIDLAELASQIVPQVVN